MEESIVISGLVSHVNSAFLPALIAAGASLAGGFLSSRSAAKAQKQTFAREDTAVQRRVSDAKAAGVHPLYALGAPLQSAPAQSVGEGMAGAVSNMGQDISRAAERYTPMAQRMNEFQARYNTLTLQNMELQNSMLASKIMTQGQAGNPPPIMEAMAPAETTPFMRVGEDTYVFSDPDWTNAQTAEDLYGDIAQNVYGARKYAADMEYSARLGRDYSNAPERFRYVRPVGRVMMNPRYKKLRRR